MILTHSFGAWLLRSGRRGRPDRFRRCSPDDVVQRCKDKHILPHSNRKGLSHALTAVKRTDGSKCPCMETFTAV